MASSDALLVDIGNSTIECAAYRSGKIHRSRRILTTKVQEWLSTDPFAEWDRVIVSSVVPGADRMLRRYPNVIQIDDQTIPILTVHLSQTGQVGSDRIVNALGAFQKHGRGCLVVDSGTATTFCYVDSNGGYQGGVIMPGMGISSKALALFTAKIPLIRVTPRKELVGKNTREAVQIGLYRGTIHMINGMIQDFRKLDSSLIVVGTGNGLMPIKEALDLDEYDPILILRGLAACADGLAHAKQN